MLSSGMGERVELLVFVWFNAEGGHGVFRVSWRSKAGVPERDRSTGDPIPEVEKKARLLADLSIYFVVFPFLFESSGDPRPGVEL